METFVGLDVSLKETSVCVLNQQGTRVFEGKVASEPAAIARLIRKHAPNVVRVGLESGPTSVWLSHGLSAEGLQSSNSCAACFDTQWKPGFCLVRLL
jgi:transposase